MPARTTTLLRLLSCVLLAPFAHSQPTPAPAARPNPNPTDAAGIAVNYDEAKTGSYTLTDPLVLKNGKPVRDAKTWFAKRRPEIVEMFETQQYGRAPGRPMKASRSPIRARPRSMAKPSASR